MGRHRWSGVSIFAGGEGTDMFDAEFVVQVRACQCGAKHPEDASELARVRAILDARAQEQSEDPYR